MEKIINIEDINEGDRYNSVAGFAITTDEQVIKLIIDNDGQCCERWGYFMSEDDFSEFIGSEIIDISITDTALNTEKWERAKNPDNDDYESNDIQVMFVNISTTNGILQFTAYNEHNGYYGHEAKVISTQLNHEECL